MVSALALGWKLGTVVGLWIGASLLLLAALWAWHWAETNLRSRR